MQLRTATIWSRVARGLLSLLAVLVLGALGIWMLLRASLPQLTGEAGMEGLGAPVTVERDALGTVVIKAGNWHDAAKATGFVHAQERFFEMDLTRRSAAGELSALFGAETLDMDKEKRVHRLRARMRQNWLALPTADQTVLTAYASGVNAGLAALNSRPWQYWLIGATPAPWREEDSLLVIAEMYYVLQSRNIRESYAEALLQERIGENLFNWMKPRGGMFDAALDQSVTAPVPLPTEAELNTRTAHFAPAATRLESGVVSAQLASLRVVNANTDANADPEFKPGSNNWAVAGKLSRHGAPILADDMHLSLSVPNIWFRLQFEIAKGPDGQPRRMSGVTLPGVPSLVVGSNGSVAWGFTSAEGDWFDWIPVRTSTDGKTFEVDGKNQSYEVIEESIAISGAAPVNLTVRQTPWGPVLHTQGGRAFVLSWMAHWPGAIDARLEDILWANDIESAMEVAQSSGVPQQNILLADRSGNIAWTLAGRLPARKQTREGRPRKGFSTPQEVPEKWLPRNDYPIIKNPTDGRLWTANNRQLGGAEGEKIGEGRGDLGARGLQIRDRLREQSTFDERDLYAIQRDSEARLMKRWVAVVGEVAARNPKRAGFADVQRLVARWNGQAGADQSAYALARTLRVDVQEKLKNAWVAAAAPGFTHPIPRDGRMEYAVWSAVTAKPLNLLPLPHQTWEGYLEHELGAIVDRFIAQHGSLDNATWGNLNKANIAHPISLALPALAGVLNMPRTPLAGDNHMPMVATRNDGASERMVVAPGREAEGILDMPGGQSGHPLSPFYGSGHQEWLDGRHSAFLAGATKYRLQLKQL